MGATINMYDNSRKIPKAAMYRIVVLLSMIVLVPIVRFFIVPG